MLVHQPTHDDVVRLAFDEARRSAATQPAVCVYLLEGLDLLTEAMTSASLPDRTPVLEEEARLVVAGCEAAELLPTDLRAVQTAFANQRRTT